MDEFKVSVNADLAYLLGVIIGDGYVKELKRNRGGFYHEVIITGRENFIKFLSPLFIKVFGVKPYIYRDKRKTDCIVMRIHSHPLYNFLMSLGFKPGKKAGNIPKIKLVYDNPNMFKNFLAGLIETDGYVHFKYIALVQKDKKFLSLISRKSNELFNVGFSEAKVNRIYNGNKYWWITTSKVKDFNAKIPLRYRAPLAQLANAA